MAEVTATDCPKDMVTRSESQWASLVLRFEGQDGGSSSEVITINTKQSGREILRDVLRSVVRYFPWDGVIKSDACSDPNECNEPQRRRLGHTLQNDAPGMRHVFSSSHDATHVEFPVFRTSGGFLSIVSCAQRQQSCPLIIPDVTLYQRSEGRVEFHDAYGDRIPLTTDVSAVFSTADGVSVVVEQDQCGVNRSMVRQHDGGHVFPNCIATTYFGEGSHEVTQDATAIVAPTGAVALFTTHGRRRIACGHFTIIQTADGVSFAVGARGTILGRTLIQATNGAISMLETPQNLAQSLVHRASSSKVFYNVSAVITDETTGTHSNYAGLTVHVSADGHASLVNCNGARMFARGTTLCLTDNGTYFSIGCDQMITGSSLLSLSPCGNQHLFEPVAAMSLDRYGHVRRCRDAAALVTPDGHVAVSTASGKEFTVQHGCILLLGHDGTRVIVSSDGTLYGRVLLRNSDGQLTMLEHPCETTAGLFLGKTARLSTSEPPTATLVNCVVVLLAASSHDPCYLFRLDTSELLPTHKNMVAVFGIQGLSVTLQRGGRVSGHELAIPPDAQCAVAIGCMVTVVDLDCNLHFYTAATVVRYLKGRFDVCVDDGAPVRDYTVLVVTMRDDTTLVLGPQGHICRPVILASYDAEPPMLLGPTTPSTVLPSVIPDGKCSFITAATAVLPSATALSDVTIVVDGQGGVLAINAAGAAQRLPRGTYVTTPWNMSLSIGEESRLTGSSADIAAHGRLAVLVNTHIVILRRDGSFKTLDDTTVMLGPDGLVTLLHPALGKELCIEDAAFVFADDGTRLFISHDATLVGSTLLFGPEGLVAVGDTEILQHVEQPVSSVSAQYPSLHISEARLRLGPKKSSSSRRRSVSGTSTRSKSKDRTTDHDRKPQLHSTSPAESDANLLLPCQTSSPRNTDVSLQNDSTKTTSSFNYSESQQDAVSMDRTEECIEHPTLDEDVRSSPEKEGSTDTIPFVCARSTASVKKEADLLVNVGPQKAAVSQGQTVSQDTLSEVVPLSQERASCHATASEAPPLSVEMPPTPDNALPHALSPQQKPTRPPSPRAGHSGTPAQTVAEASAKNEKDEADLALPSSAHRYQVQMLTNGITVVIRDGSAITHHGTTVLLTDSGRAFLFDVKGELIRPGDSVTTAFYDGTTISLKPNGYCVTGSHIRMSPRSGGSAVIDDCCLATIEPSGKLKVTSTQAVRISPDGSVEIWGGDAALLPEGIAAAIASDGTTITIGKNRRVFGRTLVADAARRVFVLGAERPCCTTLVGQHHQSVHLGSIVAHLPVPGSQSGATTLVVLGGTATAESHTGNVHISGPDGGSPRTYSGAILVSSDGTQAMTDRTTGRLTACGGCWQTRTATGEGSLLLRNTCVMTLSEQGTKSGRPERRACREVLVDMSGLVLIDGRPLMSCAAWIQASDGTQLRVGFDGYLVGRVLLLDETSGTLRFLGPSQQYATSIWGRASRASCLHGCTIVTSDKVLHGSSVTISSSGRVAAFPLGGMVELLPEGTYIAAADGSRAMVKANSMLAGDGFCLVRNRLGRKATSQSRDQQTTSSSTSSILQIPFARITIIRKSGAVYSQMGSVSLVQGMITLCDRTGQPLQLKGKPACIQPLLENGTCGGPSFVCGPDHMLLGQLFIHIQGERVLFIRNSAKSAMTLVNADGRYTTHMEAGAATLRYGTSEDKTSDLMALAFTATIDTKDKLQLAKPVAIPPVTEITMRDGTRMLIGSDGVIKARTLPGVPFLHDLIEPLASPKSLCSRGCQSEVPLTSRFLSELTCGSTVSRVTSQRPPSNSPSRRSKTPGKTAVLRTSTPQSSSVPPLSRKSDKSKARSHDRLQATREIPKSSKRSSRWPSSSGLSIRTTAKEDLSLLSSQSTIGLPSRSPSIERYSNSSTTAASYGTTATTSSIELSHSALPLVAPRVSVSRLTDTDSLESTNQESLWAAPRTFNPTLRTKAGDSVPSSIIHLKPSFAETTPPALRTRSSSSPTRNGLTFLDNKSERKRVPTVSPVSFMSRYAVQQHLRGQDAAVLPGRMLL